MNIKDLVTIAAVAAGTATLTVAIGMPETLEAGNEGAALPAQIARPKLIAQGVEVALTTPQGQSWQAGQKPVLQLAATNPKDEATAVSVHIAMTAISPASMLSRTPVMPVTLWEVTQSMTLRSSETRSIEIPVPIALPTNQTMTVYLAEADLAAGKTEAAKQPRWPRRIAALSFSTAAPGPHLDAGSVNQVSLVSANARVRQ